MVGALVLLLAATAMIVAAAAGARSTPPGAATPGATAPGVPTAAARGAYPVAIEGRLDEPLSRWLWLVKWWLLAIPHYLIIGLLVGGGVAWQTGNETWGPWMFGAGGGVIGVLVLVAGIVLLFRATYPRGLFDIVVGLATRAALRAGAYRHPCCGRLGTVSRAGGGPCHRDGARGVVQDLTGHRTEEQAVEPAASPGADDQEVGAS